MGVTMFNIIDDLVEVELKNPDDFLKIKETLTRIGIPSKKEKVLVHKSILDWNEWVISILLLLGFKFI